MISTVTKLILIGICLPHCTSPFRLLLQCLPVHMNLEPLVCHRGKYRITEFLTSGGNLIKIFLSSDCLILCEFVTQFFLSIFYLFLHIISQIFRLFRLSSVAAGMHWTARLTFTTVEAGKDGDSWGQHLHWPGYREKCFAKPN